MIEEFLDLEVTDKGLTNKILHFINSYEIRKGEFECNCYVIEKVDSNNFIIYFELIDNNNIRSIFRAFAIYRHDLQKAIIDHAQKIGIEINKEYLI